jgi:hypothetical protein
MKKYKPKRYNGKKYPELNACKKHWVLRIVGYYVAQERLHFNFF